MNWIDRLGTSEQDGAWDTHIMHYQIQKFANQLFADVYETGQSKLDALVLGHVAHFDSNDPQGELPLPQHCFVKGVQNDFLGRTVVVAVPVTRMMLRESYPCTDILDIDFLMNEICGFEGWASRSM